MLIYLFGHPGCDEEPELEKMGHSVIRRDGSNARDAAILQRCDAVVVSQGWEDTYGLRYLFDYIEKQGVPVYSGGDFPEMHPTELRSPVQVEEFMNIVMKMYRTHLEKNADYSPANILGTGEIGLATRTWDKVSRLMNLVGFRIEIAESFFEKPRAPKNESIADNLLDMAVYSVIWMLHRRGAWGR